MAEKILTILFRIISSPVYADPPQIDATFITNIESLINRMLPIGVLLAVGVFVYGGYMWIISGGDASRKQVAQGTLTWGLLGLVFLFLIKAVLTVILEFFVV